MNTQDRIRMQSHKDPVQLEREIDQQRDHIAEIVHALENKMSPGDMFERVLSYGKGGGREFASNLSETVKANPLPTLLTAAGLVWLYAGHDKRSNGRYPTTQSTGYTTDTETKAHLGERMGHMREGMSDKFGSAKERVGQSAHGAMDSVRHQAHRANVGYHNMLDHNPMALGAIGIAVGALIGAMLPPTRKEDELMGAASDHLTEEAKHLARSGYDKTAEAGREVSKPSGAGSQTASAQVSSSSGSSGLGASSPGTSGESASSESPSSNRTQSGIGGSTPPMSGLV